MTYLFAANEDYSDFAAGSVLYNRSGATSFPVRLADEIFLRAKAHLPSTPVRIYDPCCGTGYLLTVLGLRHGQDIAALAGSDIDENRVEVARTNLALLTTAGLQARRTQLENYLAAYAKESHRLALQSLSRLEARLPAAPIETQVFTADALQPVTQVHGINLLITDVPYGDRVNWQHSENANPVYMMLEALRPALAVRAVLAIVTDKSVKVRHEAYQRLERFQIGKRQITLLKTVS
jgi:23S rRNA (guanine2535-N1)-methyltransferase